jgi:hypothetical protein
LSIGKLSNFETFGKWGIFNSQALLAEDAEYSWRRVRQEFSSIWPIDAINATA